ncbi:MAG TPA: DsrE family protein [Zeimonas sp.]|nr:DsrE family protein [Zeimonas sp.]
MTTETPSYLIMLTRFDGETDRVATALALANGALAAGGDVLLWLTVDGAKLARRGAADALVAKNFPPVAELLAVFVECGGRVGVCPPCGATHGVTDETLLPGAQWMGAAAMLLEARERQVFSF